MNMLSLFDRCVDGGRDQNAAPPPILLYTGGPSGSGKNVILAAAMKQRSNLAVSISATTRPPRQKSNGCMELNGVDYYFMERSAFEADVSEGYFLEHAEVHGNLYGTPWDSIEHPWSLGKSIVGDVDVQGITNMMNCPDPRVRQNLLTVFISAPSAEEMCVRMKLRDSNTSFDQMECRVETAKSEIPKAELFDHIIINDIFEDAVAEFLDLVDMMTSVMSIESRHAIFKRLYHRRREALRFLKERFKWDLHPKWAVRGASAAVNL